MQFDPDAYLAAKPSGFDPDAYLSAKPSVPDTSLTQNVKVAARAAYPYATAAGLGAIAGAPFGGPVGSLAGAGLATLGLGLGDIGTAGYNVLADYLGGRRVALPSETIQQMYGAAGLGAEPQTPGQRVLSNAVSGALGAGAQAKALNVLAPMATSPVTRNVMATMGQQPVTQASAGAGAAALPSAMEEYLGVTNPYALAAGTVAGGVLGGKAGAMATDVARGAERAAERSVAFARGEEPLTPDRLRTRAKLSFRTADESGAAYRPDAFGNFTQNAVKKLEDAGYYADNPEQGALRGPLARMEKLSENPPTISELHDLRQQIGSARGHQSKDVRRLAGILTDELDSFIANPKNAVAGAEDIASEAGKALRAGISDYKKLAKSEEIERLMTRAKLASADTADALRSQFRTLANNPARMRRFDPNEQAVIREIAEGKTSSTILTGLSKFSPGLDVRGLLLSGLALAPGAYSQSPEAMAAGATLGALGLGARGARNVLAQRYARDLAAGIRRGDVAAPVEFNRMLTLSPTAQQLLLQPEYAP